MMWPFLLSIYLEVMQQKEIASSDLWLGLQMPGFVLVAKY